MKMVRVKFYKNEYNEAGNLKQQYLGFVDVLDSKLADGCSTMAKAFRMSNAEQKTANAVEVIEL